MQLSRRELTRVRRQLVGFVFQSFNLLDTLTAQENVEIALNVAGVRGQAAAARTSQLLADAGSSTGRDSEPGISRPARSSESPWRAPWQTAPTSCSQPTANLDSSHGRDVAQFLRTLGTQKGTGVVIVSHDERLEAICDRVLRLEDGSLRGREQASEKARRTGQGSPRCALTHPGQD